MSAIALITSIIEKLPVELLETHSQLFFLPLVLQFVNDDSKACREALSDCLSRLLSRASMEVVQSFYFGNWPFETYVTSALWTIY